MAEKIFKIGKQYREIKIERSDISKEKRTVSLSFSSEAEYERWFGIEILDHSPDAVDLRRLKRGGALLIDHDTRNQVGVIEEVTIGADRMGRSVVRFGRSAKAEEIFQDVLDGIRSNVSVGYQVNEMKLEKAGKDSPDVYRVTKWEPLEISLVSVPADINVGVGRITEDGKEFRVIIPDKKEEKRMNKCEKCGIELVDGKCSCSTDAAIKQQAQIKEPNAVEYEKMRKSAIEKLTTANKIDPQIRDMWITQGATMEQVADDILKILEERGKTNPQPASKLGLNENETRRFSLARAIVACKDNNWQNAGFEAECSRAVAQKLGQIPNPNKFYVPFEVMERPVKGKRDLTAATAGAGGYLVSTDNIGFIEMLRNRSVAFRMGARRLSGLSGSVTVPRQSAAATGYWLANEATAITESQQTFVQMALTPKQVGAYTEISRQLLLQSSPGVEGIVSDDLAQVVALAADLGALEGSGASGQPTGIANTSGIGSVTGTSLAYAGIIEFQTDVASANVSPLRGGYVTTPAVSGLLMARNKVTNDWSPLWEGNVWDGVVSGFPAMSSNQLTAATMIFGDWQELVIAEWGVLEIEVNPYANFAAGIIGVRAIYSMDIGVRRPFAFSRATSIT